MLQGLIQNCSRFTVDRSQPRRWLLFEPVPGVALQLRARYARKADYNAARGSRPSPSHCCVDFVLQMLRCERGRAASAWQDWLPGVPWRLLQFETN